jgi:hypothetical protein
VLLLPLRAQAGPGRPRGTTIQLFLTATRPAAISSASTSSSTMCTRPPADRTHAHRGAWGHARADHLGPPPAEAARPPPSAMSQPDGQRREPLVLEEEHELDRDHREQLSLLGPGLRPHAPPKCASRGALHSSSSRRRTRAPASAQPSIRGNSTP